jgi:hypothetical protein
MTPSTTSTAALRPGPHRMTPGRRWSESPRSLAIALALVVAAAAVAGCGSTASGSPTPSATPVASVAPGSGSPSTPAPASGGPAPSVTPLPAGSFTFDLPSGWKAVPVAGDHAALLATLTAANSTFAESLGARLAALPKSATYVAFNATPSVIAKGDLVTLIVTEVPLPLDVTLETFATTLKGNAEQLAEADLQLRRILVTAGQAYSVAYAAPLVRPDGQEGTLAVTQVFYVLPGHGYVLTFAASPGTANDHAKDIADIATSFTIRP